MIAVFRGGATLCFKCIGGIPSSELCELEKGYFKVLDISNVILTVPADNSEIHTFESKDDITGSGVLSVFQFSIKKKFLKILPDPENYTPHDLFDKHQMYKYLHNTDEPAVVLITDHKSRDTRDLCVKHVIPGFEAGKFHFGEWWIDGKRLSAEEELVRNRARK